jgi:hypothetical protein
MVRLIVTGLLLFAITTTASAQWMVYIEAIEYAPVFEPTLLVVPDGSGPPMSQARYANGEVVDATVTVYLVTDDGSPIAGFPAEDVWLDFNATGDPLRNCDPNFAIISADGPSSPTGRMTFSLPVAAGGWTEGPATIYIYGSPARHRDWTPWDPLPMRLNSPDISGDHQINLIDLTYFSQDYFGDYNFRSDLYPDGDLDLADVVYFTRGLGRTCP